MATINRALILNPVEPAPFSFRATSGLQTSINVSLFDTNGTILRQDLGLQMQLTSRSRGSVTSYTMPATDVANGKAMASIPADDLTDPNGYNVHIYGTWKSGAELLGRGILRLTGGPGIRQQPKDVIDDIQLFFTYGLSASITINLWQDAAKTIPFDLDSALISAAVYASQDSPTVIWPFDITRPGEPGQVILSLTSDQIDTLYDPSWWALRASSGGGLITLCQGSVQIAGVKP
jgi:hypothetical protein